jgi:hypothetical protein
VVDRQHTTPSQEHTVVLSTPGLKAVGVAGTSISVSVAMRAVGLADAAGALQKGML